MDSPDCQVYWIRAEQHTDIFTEGYVGITLKSVEQRFKEHKWKAGRGNTFPLSHAILKYGDKLICRPVLVGSQEHCRLIENKLRPVSNVGWNLSIGGDVPPMTGRKHSEEARKKMSTSLDRSAVSERNTGNRNAACPNGWENPRTERKAKIMWALAAPLFSICQAFPNYGFSKVHTLLGLRLCKYSVRPVYNKIKSGWNPSEDKSYAIWLQTVNFKE